MSKSLDISAFFDRGIFLAPMAGVNDPAFRAICKSLGANLTYSEMVSAKGLEYGNKKSADLLTFLPDETPIAVQLFGKDPKTLAAQAARIEFQYGDDIALIDINMACPMRKITGKGEGAALMCDPVLAAQILQTVVKAVQLPVTVKFRKGYELDDDMAVSFARMAEDCGVAAMTLHGRTAKQLYHGTSDREVVRRVKRVVSVPVIASGDVFAQADIDYYHKVCGANAVMIARGARGNPWIFAGKQPTIAQRVDIAKRHVRLLNDIMPQRLASMRKHIAWYFKGVPGASKLRCLVNDCHSLDEYIGLLEQLRV